jgi:hypothetical protein
MQQELLQRAGFAGVTEIDVSDEFLRVVRAWTKARERYADPLRAAEGGKEFDQKQVEHRGTAAGIEGGLLRRSLFVARRP